MQSVSSNAVATTLQGYATISALNGYNNNTSYISTQALQGLIDKFNATPNYQPFDYSTSSGVEYRARGFRHTTYGMALCMTRGYLIYVYISNGAVTKQRILLNIN